MERHTWKATVLPGKLNTYVERHNHIWPEMKETLKAAGIRNYTIWSIGNELFGYYECDSVSETLEFQKNSPVVQRWDEYMKDIMCLDIGSEAEQPVMRQVFLLP